MGNNAASTCIGDSAPNIGDLLFIRQI